MISTISSLVCVLQNVREGSDCFWFAEIIDDKIGPKANVTNIIVPWYEHYGSANI